MRPAGQGGPAANRLSTEVYERLRTEIVKGRLRPNELLIETDLAERLAVSRTPIRESLQRLAADGLIVNRRRGWAVREHTPEEIRQLYEIRAALEGYAARLATARATDAELASVAACHRDNIARATQGSRDDLVDVNDEFHETLISAAGNERLAELIRRTREFYFNYRIAATYTDAEAAAAVEGHGRLVDALLARDADRAEAEARAHVEEALGVVLRKLR